MRHYGVIAKPLTQLLQKKQFEWNDQAEKAFFGFEVSHDVDPSTRALPNFQEPFTIETNACDGGIGAILMQKEQPVAFLSKALGDKAQTPIYL